MQAAAPSKIWFPPKLRPLFRAAPYKVLYSGRGAAKSWSIVRALIMIALNPELVQMVAPLRILCTREMQSSILESVHQLISEQIEALGYSDQFDIEKTSIRAKNGSEFIFAGLKHNVGSIKSMEGIDICWVEEAVNVSKTSWTTLIPTIRKPGAEIWISFNPELDTDETYVRWVLKPPPGTVQIKLHYSDNPWFPETLRKQMESWDPDDAQTVWEGHTRQFLEGSIYAKELKIALAENRIARVPIEPTKPIHTFWDLGKADMTAIWFMQSVGMEYRAVDYYQANGEKLSHYIKLLQDRKYYYGTHWLPHDARHDRLGADKTIEAQLRDAKIGDVQIVPSLSIFDGINAARNLFAQTWFDETRCQEGLNMLRRYIYARNNDGTPSKQPFHNLASHCADAWRMAGVALKREEKVRQFKMPEYRSSGSDRDWMR